MKKLTFLFAAFLLGLFVSITIHACGGDNDGVDANPEKSEYSDVYKWDTGKVKTAEVYENGRLSTYTESTYSKEGLLLAQTMVGYGESGTTISRRVESTYTYSGNTRTINKKTTYYLTNGSVDGVDERKTIEEI